MIGLIISAQTAAKAKTTPSRTNAPLFEQRVSRQVCRKAAIPRLACSLVSAHPCTSLHLLRRYQNDGQDADADHEVSPAAG